MFGKLKEIFGDVIILEEGLTVSTDILAKLFIGCTDVNFDELKRVDEENSYGYSIYIDRWKQQGLIN